jgi:20S proteasome alpha/beta subunit
MTVCIAAHCFRGGDDCIICATDALISTGDMSADLSARKIRYLGHHWVAMFAGDDISSLAPILDYVKQYLVDKKDDSLPTITTAFTSAYKEQLRLKAEAEVLTPIGYTLDEFKKEGLRQLGPENFSRLLYEIEKKTVDIQFLLAGFDDGEEHIFTVASHGQIDHYTELGFWAIGVGSTQALGSMFSYETRVRFATLPDALYRVCEAKFASENAPGVGITTRVGIIFKNGTRVTVKNDDVDDKLRAVWKRARKAKVPDQGTKIADKILREPVNRGSSQSTISKQ